MLEQMSKAMFADTLGSNYQLRLATGQEIPLEMIEIREGRSSPRQEQFALLFRGPLDQPFWQGLWPLHHAELGELELFLVPIGKDSAGFLYEAVFNRLL